MHTHSHGGGHLGHSHGHAHEEFSERMGRVMAWSVVATLLLVAAEFAGGWLSHSISLVSDAVHNLTDVPALVISWLAARWALKPPTEQKTYGYHRSGILAAFVNALLLWALAAFIVWEAVFRLWHPVPVRTGPMLWIALAAVAVNAGIATALVQGNKDLNIRAVLIHFVGDALSSLAILVGAWAIQLTGAVWVDPVIGIGVGAVVLWSGYGILRQSAHILLEGIPPGLNLNDLVDPLLAIEGVQEIHDVHVWTLGTDLHALSCHVRIPDMHMEDSQKILEQIHGILAEKFRITHSTIQFERAGLPADAGYFMPESASPQRQ
jgi:cobalt-zinc-cadmium efflux system protein